MKNSEKNKTPCTNIYSVRDTKSSMFLSLMESNNDDIAKRRFSISLQDTNLLMHKFPEDFELYRMGDFDPSDGQIDVLPEPVLVCLGLDLIAKDS